MNRFDVVVAYDVDTTDPNGRNRLRQVATVCKKYGQRVQFSVFECRVSQMQLEMLEAELLRVMDVEKDNLRIYILYGRRDRSVRAHGRDTYVDFDDLLIV